MKWYKHFSRAHRDTKIKKLINEFGADAYAVYFYCLELIAESIDTDNITFELEDDAELIGQYLRIDTLRVERIMLKCIELDLFGQADNGRITCFKMAKFLDDRLTRNIELKTIISSNKMAEIKEKLTNKENLSEMSETVTDKTRHSATVAVCPDQIRLDENRLEKNKINNGESEISSIEVIEIKNNKVEKHIDYDKFFEKWYDLYDKKVDRKTAFHKFKKLKLTDDLFYKIMNHTDLYVQSTPDPQYRKNPSTYLNQESWNDEIIKPINVNNKHAVDDNIMAQLMANAEKYKK